MRLMANYFDHLLSLDTPTYTVAQIAKRFEPNTVLWAFHTIQPSSYALLRRIAPSSVVSPSVCAKTAEPIEVPFGLWARMGRKHHVLHGRSRSPMGRGYSGG